MKPLVLMMLCLSWVTLTQAQSFGRRLGRPAPAPREAHPGWRGDPGGLRTFLAGQGETLGLTDTQRHSLQDGSLKIVFLD